MRYDPDLAQAHAALARLLGTFEWDWESAEREFETALELAPTPAVHRAFAELLSARGRHEEALAQVAMASRKEPGAVANVAAQRSALFRARSYRRARVVLAEALLRDPTDDRLRVQLARTQEILGEPQQARITLGGSDPANPRGAYVQVWFAHFRIAAGGRERPRGDQLVRTLRRSLGSQQARNPGRAVPPGVPPLESRRSGRRRRGPPASPAHPLAVPYLDSHGPHVGRRTIRTGVRQTRTANRSGGAHTLKEQRSL